MKPSMKAKNEITPQDKAAFCMNKGFFVVPVLVIERRYYKESIRLDIHKRKKYLKTIKNEKNEILYYNNASFSKRVYEAYSNLFDKLMRKEKLIN